MNRLWAGTFDEELTASALDYTHTTDIDERLVPSDLWVNLAHALMLVRQAIIPEQDGRRIVESLLDLLDRFERGELRLEKSLEDVHLNLEQLLISELGIEVGGKVHAARSRNDQVAADTRIYLRSVLLRIEDDLLRLVGDLAERAEDGLDETMVGYTHGQPAQPISAAFWFSCHASALLRDAKRIRSACLTTDRNPLGACALAGTSFPIDRRMTTRLLGFDQVLLHAMDATSTRDYIAESIAALAILMSTFSRLAEEIVVWNSAEFGLIRIDDSLATGSSIMPQKRNPVVAELVRARAGRAYGALMHILTAIKGVTMGYSCDLQEDKPPLWQALDVASSTISIMRQQLGAIRFDQQRALELCSTNFSTATELANYLVSQGRMSFRQAHHVVGQLGKRLRDSSATLSNLEAVERELAGMGIEIDRETLASVLDPVGVVARQTSQGGTSPQSVQRMLAGIREALRERRSDLTRRADRSQAAFENTKRIAQGFAQGGRIDQLLAIHGEPL